MKFNETKFAPIATSEAYDQLVKRVNRSQRSQQIKLPPDRFFQGRGSALLTAVVDFIVRYDGARSSRHDNRVLIFYRGRSIWFNMGKTDPVFAKAIIKQGDSYHDIKSLDQFIDVWGSITAPDSPYGNVIPGTISG